MDSSVIDQEQKTIETILKKYLHLPPDEELKKKIYNDLTEAKANGKIFTPFKVILRKNPDPNIRNFIEIAIETKI
ncbi:MAG: hypothetical protein S4CHLAM45_08440 [Chlamydiales bacterium]|nr:hypothetical protein [Chlamydiales bacterium]MCH9620406.1 hypothetical protein [Chlamydiales bacterium]MCH9622948.1 hypothetical protein [Chlamydiales bacterium]